MIARLIETPSGTLPALLRSSASKALGASQLEPGVTSYALTKL